MLFGRKYPSDTQGSHPPALVRAFRRPLKRQTHGAGIFTGQDFLMDVKLELDNPPTREEVRKATMQLKVGKSPGIDGIPAEVYHYGGEGVLNKLQDLFTNCWEKGTLLQDLRNAVIVSLYKNKGEKNQIVQTIEASPYSPLQANLGSRLAEQAHPDDSRGKHARQPLWVQVQQRNRRHDLRTEALWLL